jgi:hypothetical protein
MFPTIVKTKMRIVAANPSMKLKEKEVTFGQEYTINYAGDGHQPYIEVTLPKI